MGFISECVNEFRNKVERYVEIKNCDVRTCVVYWCVVGGWVRLNNHRYTSVISERMLALFLSKSVVTYP